MPESVRGCAAGMTAVNLIDWECAYGFALDDKLSLLARLPICEAVGASSHPAVIRANALIAERIPGATLRMLPGIAHMFWVEEADATARAARDFLA
mgnify:CR=1 FL=1